MLKIINYLLILLFLGSYFVYRLLQLNIESPSNFITFLNVGNGDSILIGSKNKYLLIDGGTSSYSLNNLYKYTKYTYPQSYVITHPHLDHLSSLISMLNYSSTYYDIYISENFKGTDLLNRYFYNVPAKNFKTLNSGDTLYVGDLTITVLWPNSNCHNKDPNYCSLVLEVSYYGVPKALLMADTPIEVQHSILHQVDEYLILKVPHQGADSALNQSLAYKVRPKYAVFSVGKNSYGHPSSKVLNFYKNLGSQIKRTDYLGDITFTFE